MAGPVVESNGRPNIFGEADFELISDFMEEGGAQAEGRPGRSRFVQPDQRPVFKMTHRGYATATPIGSRA